MGAPFHLNNVAQQAVLSVVHLNSLDYLAFRICKHDERGSK